MKSTYSRNNFLSWARQSSMTKVIAILLLYYAVLIMTFGFVYYFLDLIPSIVKSGFNLTSYMYFSLITSSTVGFGDMVVVSDLGKMIVSLQIITSILYTAYMTAIFTVRLFYPNNAIVMSEKILYSKSLNKFMFRVINTNREKLLNPEVRISVVFSCHGDVIAPIMSVEYKWKMAYLGKHDMTLDISEEAAKVTYSEYKKATGYEKETKKEDRFTIIIVLTGTYGMQNTSMLHKYYAKDIVVEDDPIFTAINWTGKDDDKHYMLPPCFRFHKIQSFQWKQFNSYH